MRARIAITCLAFAFTGAMPVLAELGPQAHHMSCAPTRPGLCAAVTPSGSVLFTADLGRSWSRPMRLAQLDPSQDTPEEETELEGEEVRRPFVAICDSGLSMVTLGKRALVGRADERTWRTVDGTLPQEESVGWSPPLCDARNRFWMFGKDEVFVIKAERGRGRLLARFAISASNTAVFEPISSRVLVPTRSGVIWIAAGEHLGRSGVASLRRLAPLAAEPGSGELLGVWSGRLWRTTRQSSEDLGRVPEGTGSLVADRRGRIWCFTDEGLWWTRGRRSFNPTNALAIATDAEGRAALLSVLRSEVEPAPSLFFARRKSPGAFLDVPGPPPCAPRRGFRVFMRFRGDWRRGDTANSPSNGFSAASFRSGGAFVGLSIGVEAAPNDLGSCRLRLESWSRKRRRRIIEQARLLEALVRARNSAARSANPYETALTGLEVERIERLLAVVERRASSSPTPSSKGEKL